MTERYQIFYFQLLSNMNCQDLESESLGFMHFKLLGLDRILTVIVMPETNCLDWLCCCPPFKLKV